MPNGENDSVRGTRSLVILAAIGVAFLCIVAKLYDIQIVHHADYLERSEQNAMRTVPIEAVRGRILDRRGRIIVGNRPAYTVGVIPAEVPANVERLDSVLSPVLDIPRQTLVSKVTGAQRGLHRPVDLSRDTPFSAIAYLEEHRHSLPGIVYFAESRRRYPYGSLAAHVVGYIREVTESQLAAYKGQGYSVGDLVGQSGIEAEYESVLRGTKGEEYQEVTASGRVVASHRREPVRGSDVRLTIDLRLQQLAEAAMDTVARGALVAMDPRTGAVLAMVSRPTFDPEDFSFVVAPKVWKELNDNDQRPLFNRATMGTYPPGSTAKMIAAVAALQSGIIDSTTTFEPCTGVFWYGNRPFRCWLSTGHGLLDVVQAIEASCDIYFYQLGLKLGMDNWAAMARRFGFGSPTGIDLPQEASGIVASTEEYNKKMGRFRWGGGEMLNVVIGQGITLVTPIQMVRYVSALATGKLVTPHLAAGFIDADGNERLAQTPPPVPLGIDSTVLATIRHAMILVTEGPMGTAHRSRVPGYHVAGKTGTAQNPHGASHSWYVGYAPAYHPVIAVAVICENVGHGSDFAAPIAGEIMRERLLGPEWNAPPPQGVEVAGTAHNENP